jgi:ribosomal protein S18 acetylase RimI-like enzyme
LRTLRSTFAFINSHFDVFDHYNVNHFVYAHGLAISPNFRGRGIATELLKARVPFLKAHDLAITSSLFTTLDAQRAALRAGFHEDLSMSYEILQRKFSDFDFSNANCADCKLLSLKI